MKTLATVSWAYTVEVDVDENKLLQEGYIDEIRSKAVEDASANLNWRDGIVTDCETHPELIE